MKINLLLIWIVSLLVACGSKSDLARSAADKDAPILLIGLDGLEWNVVLPMIRRGQLPVLQQLMHRGTYGLLKTQVPTSSPVLWTTIATGKKPQKHGIRGFVRKQIKNARPLYTNADRKTKAFWNIFSDYGFSVRCIGWWLTYPVEPVKGIMVAQTNTIGNRRSWRGTLMPDMDGQVYPEERTNEFVALIDKVEKELPSLMRDIFGELPPQDPDTETLLVQSRWAVRADAIYQEIAERLAKEGKAPQITALYFGASDALGHRFWQFYEPLSKPDSVPPPAKVKQFGRIIPNYYAHLDSVIGKIVNLYPKETTIFVLSDHGFGPEGHHIQPPPDGFFVAAGSSIRKTPGKPVVQLSRSDLQEIGSIMDIAPTLLALKNIPLGKDMDGKVLEGILDAKVTRNQAGAVATHDTPQWLASRPKVKPGKDVDPERLEQLRALGYIQ